MGLQRNLMLEKSSGIHKDVLAKQRILIHGVNLRINFFAIHCSFTIFSVWIFFQIHKFTYDRLGFYHWVTWPFSILLVETIIPIVLTQSSLESLGCTIFPTVKVLALYSYDAFCVTWCHRKTKSFHFVTINQYRHVLIVPLRSVFKLL